MPEYRVAVRWPDGDQDEIYSPSSIVREFLRPSAHLLVTDFVVLSRDALTAASHRVQAVYGTPCGRAWSEIRRLESTAERLRRRGLGQGVVEILTVEPLKEQT